MENPNAKIAPKREITAVDRCDAAAAAAGAEAGSQEEGGAQARPDRRRAQEGRRQEIRAEEGGRHRSPTPPKRPPQRSRSRSSIRGEMQALLDKRDAAAAGSHRRRDQRHRRRSARARLGARSSRRTNSMRCARGSRNLWNPPAGAQNPQELVVAIRIRLKPDGTLAGPPMVMTSGQSPLFMASRDSAIRAVFRGQPFNMLRPENYEAWKDIEITFDPRDMIRGLTQSSLSERHERTARSPPPPILPVAAACSRWARAPPLARWRHCRRARPRPQTQARRDPGQGPADTDRAAGFPGEPGVPDPGMGRNITQIIASNLRRSGLVRCRSIKRPTSSGSPTSTAIRNSRAGGRSTPTRW